MPDTKTIAEAVIAGDLNALKDLGGVDDYEALMEELGDDNEKVRVVVGQEVPCLQFLYNVRQDCASYPLDEDEVADIIQSEADETFGAGDGLIADLAVYVAAKIYTDETKEEVTSQRAGDESEGEWSGWVEGVAFTLTQDEDESELTFTEVEL